MPSKMKVQKELPLLILLIQTAVLLLNGSFISSFQLNPSIHRVSITPLVPRLGRSTVEDLDGPSPPEVSDEPEQIDPETILELQDVDSPDDLPTPIPHQPWRKGDMAGCDAPIAAEWRRQAEEIIKQSVEFVGGHVVDVTWFLTAVLVTYDKDVLPSVQDRTLSQYQQAVVEVTRPEAPIFYDPDDPNPEPIDREEDVLLSPEVEPEVKSPEEKVFDQYKYEESRAEISMDATEELQKQHEHTGQPFDVESSLSVDTGALSVIARAILDGLEEHEDELNILARHEVVLASPGPADVLYTQKQFDTHHQHLVAVETQDPFDSNRTLKGRLVDRNAMDVLINVKGRLVTIPQNFVKCVRLITKEEFDEDLDEVLDDQEET